ncbi:MAG: NADPH-dependent F420 reductase [Gemmatimonadales bacterium]
MRIALLRSRFLAPSLAALIGCIPLSAGRASGQQPTKEPCIAIIGTGDMGGGMGRRIGEQGRRVVYGSRTPRERRVQDLAARTGSGATAALPSEAAAACPHLLFAVPWEAAEAAIKGLGDLSGKILIDVTNPLTVRAGKVEPLPVPTSGAEQLRAWAPGVRIVKAFNTINIAVILDPSLAGGPVSVPLASDDAEALAVGERLARQFGLEPIVVGELATARFTERMAMLYVNQLVSGRPMFEYRLIPRRRP